MKKLLILTIAFVAFFANQGFISKSSIHSGNGSAHLLNSLNLYSGDGPDSAGNATVPPEIENPELLGINKEPAHATLMVYGSQAEALKGIRHASSFCRSLNGTWKFNWVDWPQKRPVDFYKPTFDVSSWKEIPVPSNWQVLGYGTPYYRNLGYIFQKDFPRVMSTPPKNFTAYQERNPVGSYRRDFEVPKDWNGRRIFLTFDGVDAGFFLWINGEKVGYSINSRNAAEFDITKYVKPGKNMVAVEVYRFTAGSFLEDQDMWRLSGIFRNVTLWSTPQTHVRDYFIKIDLDSKYENATLEVTAKVKNYGTSKSVAKKLTATLFDGATEVKGCKAEVAVPALNAGEEKVVNLKFQINNPSKWTAETPKLYTTVLTLNEGAKVTEILSSKTGFRELEIKGRLFLVNGTPIKLKGVNRHEHWPDVGHAITEAQMIRDLEVIKQGNCNHIRTCHYSDDPRWYELCDEWGIWLVAEANVECHGYDHKFDEEPRMKDQIVDRNVANTENFKNHPSVILWSLGNENGGIGTNFVAALNAVKAIDPTRYVHYERFGIKKNNPADIDSRMYTNPEGTEKIALDDTSYTKPFYLCEYAHAMFNSMGSIGEYNDLFDKYPALLGGAIWEYQDQGLYNNRDPKRPIIAYGGGFGEFPNDRYFIHKGTVFSDRSPKPHYPEMKKTYQWIGITVENPEKGTVKIRNRYQFISLKDFSGSWSLSENGMEISAGKLDLTALKPGEEKVIAVPFKIESPKAGAEYFVKISFNQNNDELWAKKGFEVASQQFQIPMPGVEQKTISLQPVTLSQSDKEVVIKGSDFTLTFDKTIGTFASMKRGSHELLTVAGGPKLHLWRAPHRNDDMWADREWVKNGVKELVWTVEQVAATQQGPNQVLISVKLKGEGKNGLVVTHKADYLVDGNGVIVATNNFESNNTQLVVGRIGVRMMLNRQLDQITYFGRGPMENYSDRKRAFDVGLYSSSIADQMTPYEKPMDCGNHEDVRWAEISKKDGLGVKVTSDKNLMQITALPYTDEEMEKKEYRIDLPQSSATVLCISHKTLGVGSNGCGPRPLKQYITYAEPATFVYTLKM